MESEKQEYRLGRIELDIAKIQESIKIINDHSGESSIAYTALMSEFKTLKDEVADIKGTISRLNWIVITAVIAAILTLVLKK